MKSCRLAVVVVAGYGNSETAAAGIAEIRSFRETMTDTHQQKWIERLEEIKEEMQEQPTVTADPITTDRISGSVWVVAADMMEGGHPQVLGVYTNEDAAREHEQAIRDNNGCIKSDGYDHPVASFWTYEKEIQNDFSGLD